MTSTFGRTEPLSIQPTVGAEVLYSSNPFLIEGGHSQHNEALLVDSPLNYDGDAAHFVLDPSVRYGDSGSYASLNSNYFRLNGSASYLTDVDTYALKAAAARDSSLYQYGLSSNGLGVRQDSLTTSGTWQHYVSERTFLTFEGDWQRSLYNQEASLTGLVDYHYMGASGSLGYLQTERNTLTLIVAGSQYQSDNRITSSRNYSARLAFDRQMSEIWKLSANLGYSKSDNAQSVFVGPFLIDGIIFGPYFVGTAKAVQRGPVFDVSLSRQGEVLNLRTELSRTYLPSGFVFLSRQDLAQLELNYNPSTRWTFGALTSYRETATAQYTGSLFTSHYYEGKLSAGWHWTENWTIALSADWVKVRYQIPTIAQQASTVSLQISRQFFRIDL